MPLPKPPPTLAVGSTPCSCRLFSTSATASARKTSRGPPHPGTPSFAVSPDEPASARRIRKSLLGFNKHSRTRFWDWQIDLSKNVLRRSDGISGKNVHAKILPAVHRAHEKDLDKEARTKRRDQVFTAFQDERQDRSTERKFAHPKYVDQEAEYDAWEFPERKWNKGAKKVVGEYGQDPTPIYTFEQREAFGLLRKEALLNEERRDAAVRWSLMSERQRQTVREDAKDAGHPEPTPLEDYDPEYDRAGLRHPLYDFFRGGAAIEPVDNYGHRGALRPSFVCFVFLS